jgi:predicted nucleic acid-binding protein
VLTVSYTTFRGKNAIVDTNVIIDLSEIGNLELLNEVFSSVNIPEAIVRHELQAIDLSTLSYAAVSISSTEGYEFFTTLGLDYPMLSEYDRTLLTIARENGLLCVTNERPMRKVCAAYNVAYTGILGVLGCACRTNVIPIHHLADLLDKLEESSCYLATDLLIGFRDEFGLMNRIV